MDFDLTPEQTLIYEYGDSISKEFDRKYWMEYAAVHKTPTELYQRIADDGFLGIMVSEEYGGSGLGMMEMALFMEGLANNGIPLLSLVISSTMSMPMLDKHGTEEIKQKYLADCCSGKKKFCFAITEPNAGSNTMQITTVAKPNGDGTFLLSGQKTFITDANDADYALVVSRTTPFADVKKKSDGFTLFVVDMKAKGVSYSMLDMSIPIPESQCQVFFDEVEVTEADALGEIGKGFEILFDTLNPERIILSGVCTGLGRYALDKAVEYASERVVFKGPIGAYQGLQHPLAAAKTEVEMASLMMRKAAWCYDNGRPTGGVANMGKHAAAEAGIKAVDSALQCFGGNGFTKEYGIFDLYPMVRLLRTAPLNREIILSYIGEKVMGLPRSY